MPGSVRGQCVVGFPRRLEVVPKRKASRSALCLMLIEPGLWFSWLLQAMVAFLNDLLILILRVEEHLGGLFENQRDLVWL